MMNRFTLMCDNPYTTCIRAERELNKLMGEVDKLRQIKDRLLEENARLQAERDKAISTLSMYAPCSSCKFRKLYRDESPCNKCLLNKFYKNPPPCKSEWVWEGLEESE